MHTDMESVLDIKNTYNEIVGKKNTEDIISLNIDKAIKTFNSNPLQAKEDYEGKIVQLTGKVLKIGYAETEAYLILVGSSFHEGDVIQCTFEDGQYRQLAKLNRGDSIIVTGKVWIAENRFCMADCKIGDGKLKID